MSPASRIDASKLQNLIRKKWIVSLSLTAVMLAIYYGFILVLAFNKELLATKFGGVTLGLPVGLGVILSACVLTGVYVRWANGPYDAAVREILDSMKKE